MKKGRHRRFEEARAMKRDNGTNLEDDFAHLLNDDGNVARPIADDEVEEDDPYAKYADKYDDEDEADEADTK